MLHLISSQISRDIFRHQRAEPYRFGGGPGKEEAHATADMLLVKPSLQSLHFPTAARTTSDEWRSFK